MSLISLINEKPLSGSFVFPHMSVANIIKKSLGIPSNQL